MAKKTQTAITKAVNAVANAADVALQELRVTLHTAHELIQAGVKKANESRAAAINRAIEALKAIDMDPADIREKLTAVFDEAVAQGDLEKSTARAYTSGLRFALERRVMWTPNLHGAEGQIEALQAAGKAIPDSLKKKAAELEEKAAAKRDAKSTKAHVANVETVVKALAKALADLRTLGKPEAADCLDLIHRLDPAFKEPAAQ